MTVDPNTSSLRDNQIKNEINAIRSVLSSTNYKIKLSVALISESDSEIIPDLDIRLAGIRKNTGLDTKHLYFFGPPFSSEALFESVKSILLSLQPFCIEYYRDLSKHSRRKRNRSSVPPPTSPPTSGTSHALSTQGWTVRYEFKLGIFAEFRQEFDAACRNYESAHDGIFSAEILGSIPIWSPRFNEVRFLADAIAIRILRCLLYAAQFTQATRFWSKHRERTKELVESKGTGSNTYAWETWEAIWATSFAQLRAESQRGGNSDGRVENQTTLQFTPAEKAIPIGERLKPWELLHHEGYWLTKSAKHTRNRRDLALQIPEEDRVAPRQTERSTHLDTYLALPPHLEYERATDTTSGYHDDSLDTLRQATAIFSNHHQDRFAERLRMDRAGEFLRKEAPQDAAASMRPLWSALTWRQSGWWNLTKEAALLMREAAVQSQDRGTLLRLNWEAHNSAVPLIAGLQYDLTQAAGQSEESDGILEVTLNSRNCLSPIWASFGFSTHEGNVGEPLRAKLTLVSNAHPNSQPIPLSEVEVQFQGAFRPIKFRSGEKPSTDDFTITSSATSLSGNGKKQEMAHDDDGSSSLPGGVPPDVDLAMNPQQRRSFQVTLSPRDAGEVKTKSISLICQTEAFKLTYVIDQETSLLGSLSTGPSPFKGRLSRDVNASTIQILPKPPKLKLSFPKIRKYYYTNEVIGLSLVVENEESDTADITLRAQLVSSAEVGSSLRWADASSTADTGSNADSQDATGVDGVQLPSRRLPPIESGGRHELSLLVEGAPESAQHELQIIAQYRVQDDPEIELTKNLTAQLIVSRPFEANYEFLPRVQATPWAAFFDPLTLNAGISQQYLFVAKLVSFVTEPVVIEQVTATSHNVSSKAVCLISTDQQNPDDETSTLAPEKLQQCSFDVDVNNLKFGEGYSLPIDLSFTVHWKRSSNSPLIHTTLQAPRYLLPMSEPRVLLSRDETPPTAQPGLTRLIYTIENPSIHYLTFNLAMESSDEFAFSGPKSVTFSLVPLSRHTVAYCILAHRGERWVRVSLAVTDAYFSKALRVSPAGEGVKADGKRGVLVWVE